VSAVERALAKDPANRFPSMDAFAAELRACLAELGSPDGDATFIAPSPVVRRSAPHRAHARRRTRWPLWLALLALLVVAAAIAYAVAGRSSGSSKAGTGSNGSGGSSPVSLAGTRAYDPAGDGAEHDAEAPNATDGNPSTYWETEHYRGGLGKPGVGLVLDAGGVRELARITVRTDTPGYTAEILAGNSLSGAEPKIDSAKQTVNASTTFDLRGAKARYYIVWITSLGRYDSVHVNEVTARG
jgi:hypothetical protein